MAVGWLSLQGSAGQWFEVVDSFVRQTDGDLFHGAEEE